MMRKRAPRLRLVDTDSGELLDADIRPQRPRGRSITMLYGPNWAALRLRALRTLIEDKTLTGADYRVLLFLLGKLEPGNYIRLRAVDVAREMGMERANAARSLRRLRERKLLIDQPGFGWRLHPELAWRGDPTGLVSKRKDGSLVLI